MRPTTLGVLGVLGCGLALAGCGGSPSAPAATGPTPSPTAASASPTLPAPAELSHLAALGAKADYSASYLLVPPGGKLPNPVSIYRLGSETRVDITTSSGTAESIITPHGTYACEITPKHTACLSTTSPPPAAVDPGLERVFTAYLQALAAPGAGGYQVAYAGRTRSSSTAPAGTCFKVSGGPGGANAVAPGLYCLATDGVPTHVSYASGQLNLLTLTGPPSASDMRPPARPTPLPSAG